MSSVDLALTDVDRALTAAIVSDSCDAEGLRDQVLQVRLAPVVPGSRAIGFARTVRFAPVETDTPIDPYGAMIGFIDSLQPDDTVVVATDASNASAFWGELFSAAARARGAAAVVTDGNLRDTERISRLGFPAFGRGRRPIDYRARMEVVAVDVPVRVGGVVIDRRDVVIADDDGVVVVPRRSAPAVLDRARARATGESTVLDELLAGASVREVWDRHGLL